jgi:hypothetical protein
VYSDNVKKVIASILIIAAAIGLYVLIANKEETLPAPAGTSTQNRMMSVENYVKIYISELSPVSEVLGGRFYVTKIETDGDSGTVWYEDGHNAYVADFLYTTESNGAVRVNSFEVRN